MTFVCLSSSCDQHPTQDWLDVVQSTELFSTHSRICNPRIWASAATILAFTRRRPTRKPSDFPIYHIDIHPWTSMVMTVGEWDEHGESDALLIAAGHNNSVGEDDTVSARTTSFGPAKDRSPRTLLGSYLGLRVSSGSLSVDRGPPSLSPPRCPPSPPVIDITARPIHDGVDVVRWCLSPKRYPNRSSGGTWSPRGSSTNHQSPPVSCDNYER